MKTNRRNILKAAALAGVAAAMGSTSVLKAQEADFYTGGAPWADLLGWKLGAQAYSFRLFTLEEALQKNVSMGLRYIEVFPGQTLSKEHEVAVGPGMNRQERLWLKSLFAQYQVVPMSVGVIGAERGTFDFAAEMGIEIIGTEPPFEDLPKVDKLAQEYNISIALHNHPEPSIYWNYETVLKQIKDLSPLIGACVDTGHYARSGLSALDAVRALKGRIKSFHFKDLNEKSHSGHDVIWGTGVCELADVLKELKAQKFRGPFFAEYEHNWENSVPEVAASAKFFNEQAKELSQ